MWIGTTPVPTANPTASTPAATPMLPICPYSH